MIWKKLICSYTKSNNPMQPDAVNPRVRSWHRGEIGEDWKVRITDSSDALIFGVSEFFTVQSSIVILTPDSSSVWYTVRRYYITWTTTGNITDVDIEIYKDFSLEDSKYGIENNKSYRYLVKHDTIPSKNWTIKIIDSNNASIFDISDPFEISDKTSLFTLLSDALPFSILPKTGTLRSTHNMEIKNCFRSGR